MKCVWITGATGGIGRACALAFAKAGWSVGIGCRQAEKGTALLSEIEQLGGSGVLCPGDVRRADEVRRSLEVLQNTFGDPDALITCAGVAYQNLFQYTDEENYTRLMDTNVKGSYLAIKEALPAMIRNGSGSIVTLSSMWGQVGGSCEVIYSASKAAIIGMTKALAKEVAPSGIRVNCVSPGVILTDMTAPLGKEVLSELANETPLGKIGSPSDVANAALWLCSENASFITGQIIGVNGGFVV
ncbi:MAG: SDR family NAD(P)-dependent oxidoreductase [Eubacteriales bacterium]